RVSSDCYTVPKRNIVLIGNTGNGKSSVGNMILRKTVFITKASANSVTTQCQRNENMVSKKQITVIDTPDFFDIEDGKEEEMKSEILKALIECAEGIHTFIIVLKVGRFTKNEKKMVQQLLNSLTEDALKHTLILFTFGEQLEGQTIEEFVKTNSQLKELADKCGGRCHVIDKYWNRKKKEKQVEKILKTIDKMVETYNCYSNDLLREVDKQIKKEIIAGLRDEEAKYTFYIAFLRWAARITTLVLVDAFLGARDEGVSELISDFRKLRKYCKNRSGSRSGSLFLFRTDTTSNAATTSFEKAITLMNDAQTNMLKKK
uniref:AIG1-type G domain-containing protein n=1 Tax=Cyprinus carpio TaxID=7962 RepID=A0A8C2GCT0_CYPCA